MTGEPQEIRIRHFSLADLPRVLEIERCLSPDGHPKSPTCGHLKIPHLAGLISE
jgi:hypothetical protein